MRPEKCVTLPFMEGLELRSEDRIIILDEFVCIAKTPFKETVKIAFSKEKEGPGITGS
jgi:hypothetical protein